MRQVLTQWLKRIRFKIAHAKWSYETPATLDPKRRRFIPKGPERRQVLRLMNERWKAREPKWESFE